MKCIRNIKSGVISRVHDHIADQLMHDHPNELAFASKEEWKEARRVPVDVKTMVEVDTKVETKEAAKQAREAKKEAKRQKLVDRAKKYKK